MQVRRVIGYVRVAPREQRALRPGLDAQREAIQAECQRRGWHIVRIEEDVRSGRSLRRPRLLAALDACREREADGIVVARLDRLTYSVEDLAYMMKRAVEDGFTIVAPDLEIDLGTDSGAQLARVLAATATWQSRSVGRRARLSRERRRDGGRRGRPSSTPPPLAERIRGLRASGWTLQAICDTLNAEGVPTPRGGTQWRPTSLRAIVKPRTEPEPRPGNGW